MMEVGPAVNDTVTKIMEIARQTLLQVGYHLPTAILHTLDGAYPIVLPFKDDVQKRALVQTVKNEARRTRAYAVTTVTCARVVDSRTGEEEEAIVIVTAIQGGRPTFVKQGILRDDDRRVLGFEDPERGDHAATPGQMMIIPDWHEETRH